MTKIGVCFCRISVVLVTWIEPSVHHEYWSSAWHGLVTVLRSTEVIGRNTITLVCLLGCLFYFVLFWQNRKGSVQRKM